MAEIFYNNATATLAENINDTAEDFDITDWTGGDVFENQLRIKIDDEIMICGNISGSTMYVSRGQENTTAASHTSGATIYHILTAGGLTTMKSDILAGVAINDLADAYDSGTIDVGSNTLTIQASGGDVLTITNASSDPALSSGAYYIDLGATVAGQTNLNSPAVSVGQGGGSVAFYGVTPISLQMIDLNSDTSGSGLQTSINDLITKLHNLGLVSINI